MTGMGIVVYFGLIVFLFLAIKNPKKTKEKIRRLVLFIKATPTNQFVAILVGIVVLLFGASFLLAYLGAEWTAFLEIVASSKETAEVNSSDKSGDFLRSLSILCLAVGVMLMNSRR